MEQCIKLMLTCRNYFKALNVKIYYLLLSINKQTFEELMEISPNAIYLRIDDWFGDFSLYNIGATFKGRVIHLLDANLCYIKNLRLERVNNDFKDYVYDKIYVNGKQMNLLFSVYKHLIEVQIQDVCVSICYWILVKLHLVF